MSQVLTPFQAPSIPASRQGAADALRVRMAIEAMATANGASFINSLLTVAVLQLEVSFRRLLPWLVVVTLVTVGRGRFIARHLSRAHSEAEVIAAERPFAFWMGLQASVWGALYPITGFSDSLVVVVVVMLVLATNIANGATIIATTPRVWALVTVCCLTPIAISFVTSGDRVRLVLAGMIIPHVLGSFGSLRANHRQALDAIALRFENQELVEALAQENEREVEARQAAEQSNRAKTKFLAAASHDAQQPLHALGYLVDSLRARSLDQDAQQLVESIQLAQSSLHALHEELRELARIDSGAVVARPIDVSSAEVLRRLAAETTSEARARGLDIRFAGRPVRLHVDEGLLLRILRNLVSNALRYTERGRILVAVRRRVDHVAYQVWDTGVGIPEAELPRIFDELHRVAPTGAPGDEGLGLGLAIVERLARVMGAELRVRSVVSRGSCFELRVPLAPGVSSPA